MMLIDACPSNTSVDKLNGDRLRNICRETLECQENAASQWSSTIGGEISKCRFRSWHLRPAKSQSNWERKRNRFRRSTGFETLCLIFPCRNIFRNNCSQKVHVGLDQGFCGAFFRKEVYCTDVVVAGGRERPIWN